ncbi:cell surface protein [Filimonas lacunae]|nr:cell surface protein [Filimonas lacunae]
MTLRPIHILSVVLCVLFCNSASGQAGIAVDNIVSGTYAPGASIGVEITPSGTFNAGNTFQVYLSDASGSFASQTLISTYTATYTNAINATLPTSLAAGTGYKIKVVSTDPAISTVYGGTISVATGTTVNASATASGTNVIVAGSIYGSCVPAVNKTLTIRNNSTPGANVTVKLVNDLTGADVSSYAVYNSGINGWDLTLPSLAYYTFTVTAELNGVVSTASYTILNSTTNNNIGSNGSQTGCMPNSIDINLGMDLLKTNYPGLRYQISWGDGTTEYISLDSLIKSNGKITHLYTKTSCDEVGGKFTVTSTIAVPSNWNFCNLNNPAFLTIQVFLAPDARISLSSGRVCVNSNITIRSTSLVGQGTYDGGNVCEGKAIYTWILDGTTIYDPGVPEAAPPDQVLTFPTPGVHQITLLVSNNPCGESDTTVFFCVEDKPDSTFHIDVNKSCVPFVVKTDTVLNTSRVYCIPYVEEYTVLDSNKNVAPANRYKVIAGSLAGAEPQIQFDTAGKYYIRYTVRNSCGSFFSEKLVEAYYANVTMPDSARYCDTLRINFGTNASHKPNYSTSAIGGESYQWTVTGGAYTFVSGTATSAYPIIKFNDYARYVVTVRFTNMCGTQTSSQVIRFDKPMLININTPSANTTVCWGTTSINLAANTTGPSDATLAWTTNGASNGTFSPTNTLATTYTFGTNDIANKTATVIITITGPNGSVCPRKNSSRVISMYPENKGTSYSKDICSGTALNESLVASTTGSTFTYTSVSTANVTGATASGSGSVITDVLTNNSSSSAGTVTYTITPLANGCNGTPFTITITVQPTPALTVNPLTSAMCSGNKTGLALTSSLAGATFQWLASPVSGTASGYYTTQQGTTVAGTTYTIDDELLNTSSTDAQVKYAIQLVSANGCKSPVQNALVTIHPKVTDANAGSDKKYCNVSQVTLEGNTATVGTGVWSQTLGPAAVITNPNNPASTVTGLVGNTEYRFAWTITDNSASHCGFTTDTVIIYNRPATTTATVTTPLTLCDFVAGDLSHNNKTLTGNIITRAFESGKWTVDGSPTGSSYSFSDDTDNDAIFTVSMPGTYTLRWTISGDAGCTPSSAVLTLNVYAPPASGSVATTTTAVCAGTDVRVTLSGYTGVIQKWQYSYDGLSWVDTAVQTSTIDFLNTQDTFAVRAIVISSGNAAGCPSVSTATPITINVSALSIGGNGKDTTVCQGTSTFFTLTNYRGSVIAWQASTNGGTTWTTVPGVTGERLDYSNIQTTTQYRAVVQNGVCSQVYSAVSTITVIPSIAQPTAGSAQNLCNVTGTTLDASAVTHSGEIGVWSQSTTTGSTNAVFGDVNNPKTTVTSLSPGTYILKWTVSNGGVCGTKSANVRIDISAAAQGGDALGGGTYCRGSVPTNTIDLDNYTGNVVRWESSTDGTTWTTISNTTSTLTYNNSVTQTTYYRAVVDNGNCTVPAYSTVATVTIKNPVTTPDANIDQDLCNANGTTLAANSVNTAAGENGTWTQSVRNAAGAVIASATNPATGISGLIAGNTYTFIWSIDNGGTCPVKRDSVDVVVRNPIANIIDTTNQFPLTICEGVLVNVTGGTPTGGNGAYAYQWQYSEDNITWNNFGTLSTAKDFSFTASSVSLYIRRRIISGPCDNFSNVVVLTVRKAITNNTLASSQDICINTAPAVIVGSVPQEGGGGYIYTWEQSIDNAATWSVIASATGKDYAPGVLTQTTLYRRTVTTALCSGLQKNVSDSVIIKVNPDAKARFSVRDTIGCAPFVLTAANIVDTPYAANNGGYNWLANGVLIGTTVAFPGYTINNVDDSVTIRLVTTSLYGCKSDSMEQKFFSFPTPDPQFTVSQDSSCGPYTVHFTNNSNNSPRVNYEWDLGNGQTTTNFNPADITYPINPDRRDTFYVVKLTAVTGCDRAVLTDTIKVYAAPKATFTPSVTAGCSPLTVFFNNNSLGERITYTWNFDDGHGDSVTTSAGQTSHTFVTFVQDTFHVRLIATNSCGTDTSYYNIVVSPNPISLNMSINGDQRQGCAPLTVQFNNNTRGASAFRWDFGDGNVLNTTENIDTITHVFTTPGRYAITLIASNYCSDTTGYEMVEVLAVPEVDFTALPTQVCIGDSIHFTNNSNSTLTGLVWRFGDGDTSVVTNPNHAYKTANAYNVTLTGSIQYQSGMVCSTTATHPVTVIASLPGLFTATDTIGNCVPYTITFTNSITPSALTSWDFGDGSTATGDVVTHTYTQNGTFTVKMNSLDPGGCTYEHAKNVVIQGPEGQFIYDNGYICKDKAVRLEVNAVRTTSYKYIFGDGDTLVTNANVVFHIYKQPGIYKPAVQLLTADCGVWIYGTNQIMVDYYQTGFTSVQQKVCGNSLVAFTDTSRSYFGIQSWDWRFGDGGTSTDKNPQHSYVGTNSWPVTLIITGTSGCKDTTMAYVSVKPNNKPVVQIMAATSGCVAQPMMFTANVNSQDSVSLYAWNFSNGFATNGEQITTKFGTAGSYQVQLVAGTIFGCYDTANATFVINPTPTVSLGNDVTICRGASVQLNAAGATEAAWSPINDLDCGNCLKPVATPLETRQYVARGSNVYGCSSTDTIVINVVQPARVQVSGPDTICVGQSAQLYADGTEKYRWWPAASLSNTTIASPVASPTLTTIYSVEGSDSLNCFRDTGYITITVGQWPKISLGPDKVLSTGTEVQLTTTYINGPMVKWTWTPEANLSCSNCAVPVATVRTDVCYSVTAENIYGCEAKDTVCIQAFCESTQVFIPNAFVPGSVNNGLLMVRGKGIRSVKSFRIYNRWGQVVFERANFPPNDKSFGWDGTIKGSLPTPDVYVYTAEVICDDGKAFTYKGNVAILK